MKKIEKMIVINIDFLFTEDKKRKIDHSLTSNIDWLRKKKNEGWYIRMETTKTWQDYPRVKAFMEDRDIPYDELTMDYPDAAKMIIISDKDIAHKEYRKEKGLQEIQI